MHCPTDPLAAARGLVPLLAERALATEAARRIPDESLRALREAGLFRLLQPQRVGGQELPFGVLLQVAATLARGCASTAWVLANLASHHWMLGMWPGEAQDEVWGDDPDALIGASLIFPAGRAQAEEGGYRLSGRWGFASGIDFCRWTLVGGVVAGDALSGGAQGEFRLFLLPGSDYAIRDTWHVAGLAGTGSKEISADHVFVPGRRSVGLREVRGGASPGSAVNPGPLYRIPLLPCAGYVVAGVPLGLAQGLLDRVIDEARTRLAASSGRHVADFEAVQLKIAEASAQIHFAARSLEAGCEDVMVQARSGTEMPLADKARIRLDCAYAARLACAAVDLLFQSGGGAALFLDNPAQRAFRDAHAAAAHMALNWDAAASLYGRVALGHTAELPPYER